MLSPVKNISFFNKKIKTNHFKENTAYPPTLKAFSSLSFRGYNNIELFNDTISDPFNYKLPVITLDDGTSYQAVPDESQMLCASKIQKGDNLLFTAPTGTGKTAIAHFATTKNLKSGKRTIITVPFVALANDKYDEFKTIYGDKNVGILTGVRKINPTAPIVIMTCEILNNQVYSSSLNSNNIGSVIFDEAHFIADEQRGLSWENSLIQCAKKDIQTICLSATIGNGDDFSNWLGKINDYRFSSKVELPSKERYVPLSYSICQSSFDKDLNKISLKYTPIIEGDVDLSFDTPCAKQKRALETYLKAQNKDPNNLKEALFELRNLKTSQQYKYGSNEFIDILSEKHPEFTKSQIEEITYLLLDDDSKKVKRITNSTRIEDYPLLVNDLNNKQMLPALIFKLSKKACDDIIKALKDGKVTLTTQEEKEQIKETIEKYKSKWRYLGAKFDEDTLLMGYAAHHSDKLPQYRKLVEELFSKKLLKIVAATSTLSAGINMPARTVIISDSAYKKYNFKTNELEQTPLSANEFHQMAGRAGRRGIDTLGRVVFYNLSNPLRDKDQDKINQLDLAYDLLQSSANDLKSAFRAEPVMLAQYYSENRDNFELRKYINSSFRTYLSKNPDKTADGIIKRFDMLSRALLKQGFLTKDYSGLHLSAKGEILKLSQSANPLMLASLIYDEKLKVSAIDLCQLAGYLAGNSEQVEPDLSKDIVEKRLGDYLKQDENAPDKKARFNSVRSIFKNREDKIIRTLNECKIPIEDIKHSDSFSGYILYLWAYLNASGGDSTLNFEKLSTDILSLPNKSDDKEKNLAIADFNRKVSDGNIYKLISQSISVLKQIERICDFALENEFLYPNVEYYQNLKNTAKEAMELITKEPIDLGVAACE